MAQLRDEDGRRMSEREDVEEMAEDEWEAIISEFGHIAGRFAVNRQTHGGPPAWSLTLAQLPEILEASVRPVVARLLAVHVEAVRVSERVRLAGEVEALARVAAALDEIVTASLPLAHWAGDPCRLVRTTRTSTLIGCSKSSPRRGESARPSSPSLVFVLRRKNERSSERGRAGHGAVAGGC